MSHFRSAPRRLVALSVLLSTTGLSLPFGGSAARAQTAGPTTAPTVPTTAPAVPSTTTPSPHRSPGYNACVARVAAMKGKPVDLIFIGDSITEGWVSKPTSRWPNVGLETWNKYYAHRNALDFGVGGDQTGNVLWRLETMDVKQFHPKIAVILIGTNNFLNTPPQIADGVKAVIAKTQETFPGVKIILVSLTPTAHHTQTIADTNTIISQYGDNQSVFYFDLASKMPPVGNTWKGLGKDRLHLLPEGYEIWASNMEPLLDKLMGTGAIIP